MIQLSSHLYRQLVEYCRLQLPNEACGAFSGSTEQNKIVIQNFIQITNVATHPSHHFEFDRQSLLQLIYPVQQSPWIGIFHSHPLTAAYPSVADLRNQWQLPIYAIISFAQANHPIMKSYEILQNQLEKSYSIQEQTITILTDFP